MGTVDSFEVCPQCERNQLYSSFHTRTMEERRFCFICGYRSWTTLVRDGKTKKPKLNKNGKWMFRFYERPGHGAYQVTRDNGAGSLGSFRAPLSDKQIEECIQDWEEFPSATLIFLSRWKDDLEILVDLRPEEEKDGLEI